MSDEQPVYVLRLQALPDSVPVEVRLRRALKYLLRATRLRCLSVVEEQPGDDQAGGDRGQSGHAEEVPANE